MYWKTLETRRNSDVQISILSFFSIRCICADRGLNPTAITIRQETKTNLSTEETKPAQVTGKVDRKDFHFSKSVRPFCPVPLPLPLPLPFQGNIFTHATNSTTPPASLIFRSASLLKYRARTTNGISGSLPLPRTFA